MSVSQTTKTQTFKPGTKPATPDPSGLPEIGSQPVAPSEHTADGPAKDPEENKAANTEQSDPVGTGMAALSDSWARRNARSDNENHGRAERYAQDAQIRLLLNAMKTVAPQINALIVRPGADAGEDRQIEALEPMLSGAQDLAARLVRVFRAAGIGCLKEYQANWLHRSCMTIAAHEVASQWINDGQIDPEALEAAAQKIVTFVGALPEAFTEALAEQETYPELHARESLQLSVFNAMARIVREMEPYARILNTLGIYGQCIENMQKTLSEHAAWYHDQCVADDASAAARVMLMQAAYRDAGGIYAQCWRVEGRHLADNLAAMPIEARHQHIRHMGAAAFPVERIDRAFKRSMGRLMAVSKLALESALTNATSPTQQAAPDTTLENR